MRVSTAERIAPMVVMLLLAGFLCATAWLLVFY